MVAIYHAYYDFWRVHQCAPNVASDTRDGSWTHRSRLEFGGVGGIIGAGGGSVKVRHWLLFAGWQVAGSLVGLGARHVDTVSWLVSGFMLMPGTLLSLYVFREGGVGNNWDKWTLFAVAVSLNNILFAALQSDEIKRVPDFQNGPLPNFELS